MRPPEAVLKKESQQLILSFSLTLELQDNKAEDGLVWPFLEACQDFNWACNCAQVEGWTGWHVSFCFALLCRSNKVGEVYHMERMRMKMRLHFSKSCVITLGSIVTDLHCQIREFLREACNTRYHHVLWKTPVKKADGWWCHCNTVDFKWA